MSTVEEASLSDIRASPDDDGGRLIYADWLQENGQPQLAAFIRVLAPFLMAGESQEGRQRIERPPV